MVHRILKWMHPKQVLQHWWAERALTMAAAASAATVQGLNPNAPPASALVARLRDRARAEGRFFHVGLANNAPPATRSAVFAPAPPCNRFNNVPPPGPAAAGGLADCDDRHNHDAIGTTGNLCSSVNNPGIPWPAPGVPPPGGLPAYAAPADWPGTMANFYRRHLCNIYYQRHGPVFRVCRYCKIHTEMQPWYNGVLNDVNVTAPALSPPPAPGAPAPVIPIQPLVTTVIAGATTSAYTRFLTPLCKRCEVFEKQVYWERMVGDVRPGMVPGVDEPMLRRDPEGWPHNTCTCWGGLEGPSGLWACMECRHLRAMELHGESIANTYSDWR